VFRPEDCKEKREPWDSKLILLAAIVYVDGLENVWCFRPGPESWGWLVSEG